MKKLLLGLTTILLLAACYSCSHDSKTAYAYRLKNAISEAYDTGEVEVKIINNNRLLVSLNDSGLYSHTPEEKREIAKAIGRMANELKTGESFQAGKVKFVTHSSLGVLSRTESQSFSIYN